MSTFIVCTCCARKGVRVSLCVAVCACVCACMCVHICAALMCVCVRKCGWVSSCARIGVCVCVCVWLGKCMCARMVTLNVISRETPSLSLKSRHFRIMRCNVYSVLQCIAVSCSVLQCVMCCSVASQDNTLVRIEFLFLSVISLNTPAANCWHLPDTCVWHDSFIYVT